MDRIWVLIVISALQAGASVCRAAEKKEQPTSKQSDMLIQAPRTYCRYVPERKDDFAWENDKVAFRAYGPGLADSTENSGIDCWLKRVDYPIIDKWYKNKNYHEDHGEGCDSYKVGDSRGCGGTALWIDQKMVISGVYKNWKIIKCEPEESVFVLSYEYTVGGDSYTEEKTISIKMGDRLFKSSSLFKKNGEIAANLPVAIGLVLSKNTAVSKDPEKGWVAIWGLNKGDGFGTAIVIDPPRSVEIIVQDSGENLKDHALIITKTDANGCIEHYAGYGWAKAGTIISAEEWETYIKQFSAKLLSAENHSRLNQAPTCSK